LHFLAALRFERHGRRSGVFHGKKEVTGILVRELTASVYKNIPVKAAFIAAKIAKISSKAVWLRSTWRLVVGWSVRTMQSSCIDR